jgi:hypothetical protein
MDFAGQEAVDGIRYTWNCWPCKREEAAKIHSLVPLATMVTPLKVRRAASPIIKAFRSHDVLLLYCLFFSTV